MIRIGILGNIGSGKSFVAKQFGYHRTTIKKMYETILDKLSNKLKNNHDIKFITKFNSGVKNSFTEEDINKLEIKLKTSSGKEKIIIIRGLKSNSERKFMNIDLGDLLIDNDRIISISIQKAFK